MNINQLKYFVTVADKLSFTEAANTLFISQPTLSHGISALEADLNTQLFIRNHHSLELSPAGEILYPIAKDILSLVDMAYRKIKPVIDEASNTLRIGMMGDLLPMLFPSIISPFLMGHAEIKSSLEQHSVLALHNSLKSGKLDAIITRGSSLEDIPVPDCVTLVLESDEFCLVVPDDHPLSKLSYLEDLSILQGENLIALNPEKTSPLVNKLLDICHNRNYYPSAITTDFTLDSVLAKVSSGLGITITPKSYIYFKKYPHLKKIDLGAARDVKNDIVVAYLKSDNNPALEIFIDYLKKMHS